MELALMATRRDVFGRKTKSLRRAKTIPAVLYGHGITAQPLTVEALAFQKVYAKAKESTLVDLRVAEAAPVKVIIQDVQVDPVKGRLVHIDFHQVRMTEKLETEILLKFVGESAAVKEQGGILVKSVDKVRVSCLPADLVQSIEVDISSLKTFEDAIHIRDLAAPKGIKILEGEAEVIATIEAPRSEEELKALEEKVEANVEEVEVVGKKEKAEAEEAADDETKDAGDSKKAAE